MAVTFLDVSVVDLPAFSWPGALEQIRQQMASACPNMPWSIVGNGVQARSDPTQNGRKLFSCVCRFTIVADPPPLIPIA
jgi:hypothetical protein